MEGEIGGTWGGKDVFSAPVMVIYIEKSPSFLFIVEESSQSSII